METIEEFALRLYPIIYFVISQFMAFKYWIDYVKETDSLLKMIFFGPFIAEFKGIFWIFFI